MKHHLLLTVCLLAVSASASAAEFACTALPGTFEYRASPGSAVPARRDSGAPPHWSRFTVSIDRDNIRFKSGAVAGAGNGGGSTAVPAYHLVAVDPQADKPGLFSGGMFNPVVGGGRVTRVQMMASPLPGRFVMSLVDFDVRLTTSFAVQQERFKADCGIGPSPIALEEYVLLMKRKGLWQFGRHAG